MLAPASLGIALTGNCIATTLVGSKFVFGVAPLIPWMAASSFFSCVRSFHLDPGVPTWQTAASADLGRRARWESLSIGLSIYLIPREGPVGAAIAVAAAAVVSCVHAMIAGRYAYPIPLPIAAGIRVGICCAMMAFVVIQLPDSGWVGLILRATLGSGTYALAVVAMNLLDTRELAVRFAKRATWRCAAFLGAAAFKKNP